MPADKIRAQYQTTIGIETHVQLKTRTKLFCRCLRDSAAAEPNTDICPICLGLPGALPYLNKRAVELTLMAGLALNGKVVQTTKFDRKHYFYPDLPKGYQISQYEEPIISGGAVEVPLGEARFKVGLVRTHLEEDAGKSTHPACKDYSLVDLNRAGTPLLEIVSAPDLHSPAQAKAYVKELYLIMLYAGVSDVDLYQGNMRFDINISVAKKGGSKLGLRTEVKNLNSFRGVEKASAYEVRRQIEVLEKGQTPTQSTRGWDEAKGKTYELRTKEGEADYRYFPEPDLPPLIIRAAMVADAKKSLPQLPAAIRKTLAEHSLPPQQATALMSVPRLLQLAIACSRKAGKENLSRIANWLVRDVKTITSASGFDWSNFTLDTDRLIRLNSMVADGKLSSNGAEQVLAAMITDKTDPQTIAEAKKLLQISDDKELQKTVEKVVGEHAAAVKDYQSGNERSLQFLVGQVMRASQGRANPQLVQKLLKKQLDR